MFKKEVALVLVLLLGSMAAAHDMWLEADSFFLSPGQKVMVRNGNGTIYQKSENAVSPDRVATLLGISPDGEKIELSGASIKGHFLEIPFVGQKEGNYWVGLASKPRMISLSGKDFTGYLEHDGIPKILKERAEKGISDRDEIEEYSKYVKAYLQVGETRSENYGHPLGLAIEIVPRKNPYSVGVGDSLPLQVLYRGKPLAGLTLHAGHEGQEKSTQETETDSNGETSVTVTAKGKWYVRGIHLSQVDKDDHSYESYWCALTFQVR